MMKLNKSDMADCLGISRTAFSQWIKKGCPYEQKGSQSGQWVFDTAAVIRWREEQAALNAMGDTADIDLDEARRRKTAAEAALVEIEVSKRRGEVIEIEHVAEAVGEDYANVKAKLLALPTKLAPQLIGMENPVEIQAILADMITEALEELTVDGIYRDTEEGDPEPAELEPSAAA